VTAVADTLFGDSAEIGKPRTPAAPKVVALLVGEGVSRETAAGYENRQAWAVLADLRKKRKAVRDRAAGGAESNRGINSGIDSAVEQGGNGPAGNQKTRIDSASVGGVSLPERLETARVLEEVAADAASPADLLARVLEVSVYALSGGECRRACWALAAMLRGQQEGR
jgi:hypothetical protein